MNEFNRKLEWKDKVNGDTITIEIDEFDLVHISAGVDGAGNSCSYPIKQIKEFFKIKDNTCGDERPLRKTFCQLEKGHEGSHRAVIFWEGKK